jgi:hypothetical protein
MNTSPHQPIARTVSSALRAVISSALIGLLGAWLTAGCSSTAQRSEQQTKSNNQPSRLNLDFGPWKPAASGKSGPAEAGKKGDFWNVVGIPWNNNHTESNLKTADGGSSRVQVQLINLGGGWSNNGKMGVDDPMYNTFNYPQNNQGGDSEVILSQVAPGRYHLYIYGHGILPAQYGDYEVSVGSKNYGRKRTSSSEDAIRSDRWVENCQYVKFSNVTVTEAENIRIYIRPGGVAYVNPNMPLQDTIINGLQLISVP